MNPDEGCRHPSKGRPAYSQWFKLHCRAVAFVVRDRANPPGKSLGAFTSPRYCNKGKGSDTDCHERRADVQWPFQTDPAAGQKGADLYGYPANYDGQGINVHQVFQRAGMVSKGSRGRYHFCCLAAEKPTISGGVSTYITCHNSKTVDFATLGEANEISPIRVSQFSIKSECASSSWATGFRRRAGRPHGRDPAENRQSPSQK